MSRFPRDQRNPLAYPAGVRPGFDPEHPAAQGISGNHGFSSVTVPGGMVNLVTGSKGTNTSGNASTISNLGPAFQFPSSVATNYNWPGTTIQDQVGTLAGVAICTSSVGGGILVASDLGTGGGMQARVNGVVPELYFHMQGVSGPALGIWMEVGVPFFFALSKGPTSINAVTTNLLTGAIKSSVLANTSVPAAPSASQGVGGVANNGSFIGNIAAAMFSPKDLSLDQLRAWAQDPWTFWYPRPIVTNHDPYMQPPLTFSGGQQSRNRKNLLAYPAGARPNFDPEHPAAKGIANTHGISLVAGSGGFVNLTTGAVGTNTAGFVNGTFARLGPNLRLPSSTGSSYNFSGPNPPIADTVGTIAAIYTVDSAADAGNIFSTDSTGVIGMALRNTQFVMPGIVAVPNGLTMLANTPMFLVASKGPARVNFVMVNLLTGQTFKSVVADTNTPGTPNGATQGVGGQAGAGCIIGNVAAAMWAPNHLSMPELLAWAKDPWSFWYPRQDLSKLSSSPVSAGPITGTLNAVEAPDTALFTGLVPSITGTLVAAEATDTALFTGTFTGPITGTLGAVEAKDVAAFTGTFTGPIGGILTAVEAKDVAAFTGTVAGPITGTLTAVEARDVAFFTGNSFVTVTGTLGAIELPDVAAFTGLVSVAGTLVAVEAPDVVRFVGTSAGLPARPEVLRFGRPVTFRRW